MPIIVGLVFSVPRCRLRGSDISGKVQGVDADGALRVERSDGSGVVAIRGGVVRWHPLVGEMKS